MRSIILISVFMLTAVIACGQCENFTIAVGGGSWDSEISWSISNSSGIQVANGGAPSSGVYCLNPDCFDILFLDSFGDGWNGATMTITDSGGVLVWSGTLAGGSTSTSQTALNGGSCGPPCTDTEYVINVGGGSFDSEITWSLADDGGTVVANGAAPFNGTICIPDACLTLTMSDSFGDGWNGATFTMTDASGTLINSSTIATGSTGTSSFPVGSASCGGGADCEDYTITVGGGSFDSEVSWTLSGDLGAIVTGFAPASTNFCVEDGCYTVNMFDSFGDGWNGATWTITDAGGATVDSGTLGGGGTGSAVVQLGDADCDIPEPVTASDCQDAINVCTDIDFAIDPNGYGSVMEIPTSGSVSNPYYDGFTTFNPWGTTNTGCLLNDELNSTWMIVNIAEGGWLEFIFGGLGMQAGFYDWAMWTYDENTCSNITNNLQAPIRCNWNGSSFGGTGLVGTLPADGSPTNYEPPLWTVTGDQYIICFSNWSSVTTNVPLVFAGTAVVSCEPIMLPVELDGLTATAVNGGIHIEWRTLSEQNNAAFVLQRSENNEVWDDAAWVQGAGTSFDINRYEYFDDDPLVGFNYYRLKQIDTNGNMRFSSSIAVDFDPSASFVIMPNPVAPESTIRMSFDNVSSGMICRVLSSEGQEVYKFDPSNWAPDWEMKMPHSGLYIFRLEDRSGATLASQRLIVSR